MTERTPTRSRPAAPEASAGENTARPQGSHGGSGQRPGGPRSALLVLRTPGGLTGLALVAAVVAVAVLADVIAPVDPFASVAEPLRPPTAAHPFGTDYLGRDLLSGVVHGLRTSLLVGAAVGGIALAIGVPVGAISGYYGGLVDDALMRFTELVQVVPRFFLAVVVVALFGPGLDNLILLLGVTSWTWLARIVRAETFTLREREFVLASRALGATDLRILSQHVVPNALAPAVIMISVVTSSAILIEAGLGFVGLGDPTMISLGLLARNAQRFLRTAWWMAVFPGLAIVIAILGLNLLADSLNDVLNPRNRRSG